MKPFHRSSGELLSPAVRWANALTTAATLAAAAALHAAVPPPETLPITTQVNATGLPIPTPGSESGTSRDVCVVATRGDTPPVGQFTPKPIILRWWERGADSAWVWRGPLAIPGWPTLQNVPYGFQMMSLHTQEESGTTMLVVPVTSKKLAVAQYAGGAWSSMGLIDAPMDEAIARFVAFDGVVYGWSTQRVWRAAPDAAGAWQVVHRGFAELGLASGSQNRWIHPVSATEFLLRSPVAGGLYTAAHRYDWIRADATELVQGPQQPPLVPDQYLVGMLRADGPNAVALISRVDLATGRPRYDRIAFVDRGADGLYRAVQVEAVPGTPGVSGALNSFGSGRIVAEGRAWSRDGFGHWHAGAYVPLSARVDGASVTDGGFSLKVVANAFDCDGDGIDDEVAIANGWATDCDANGHPDDCDIALGMVADANQDGIPDHCVGDCDGNGKADLGELRLGARESCAGDGTLASCQIAAGEPDRDGNGVPDLCDADRNGNGIPDVIEIAEGAALDCDGDWRIDDAPAASIAWPIETSNIGWGYSSPTSQPGLWIMSAIQTSELGSWIDGFRFPIVVGTSNTAVIDGRELIAFVAVDPTNDLDPRDAQVVWWQSTVFAPDRTHQEWAVDSPALGYPRYWQYVATPHLHIDAPVVWVGFRFPPNTLSYGGSPSSTCALAVGNSNAGLSQLTGEPSWTLDTTDYAGIDPHAMLASPQLAPGGFDATAQAFSRACAATGDIDGNGRVDGADLGRMLGDWGPAYGSPCDLNHDNSVDGADLAILIAHFGS